MKQSRGTSFLKSIVSTGVGFVIAYIANMLILPLFGFPISAGANVLLTSIYTVISIARGYALERLFEAMGWRVRISPFAHAVLAERHRQVAQEGWSHDHDDKHAPTELARAGACYLLHAGSKRPDPPSEWRWDERWWKPTDYRRDMVRGCALAIAEGEKFDRARRRK